MYSSKYCLFEWVFKMWSDTYLAIVFYKTFFRHFKNIKCQGHRHHNSHKFIYLIGFIYGFKRLVVNKK